MSQTAGGMNMRRLLVAIVLLFASSTAWADAAVDAFSQCLAENTSGKDRKDLARWLFVSIGAHPEMRALAPISASASEDALRITGQLLTRLIADACPKQAQEAVQTVGSVAMQSAFTVLGQLAMQELMTNKDVAASMGRLQMYIDSAKVTPVLTPKQ